jgi:predicted transcriptional regulator
MREEQLDEALALDVRSKIFRSISRNPGLHFRELQRRTSLATGSLQYHLDFLQKRHLVRADKQGQFVRYYSARGRQFGEDQKLMNLLRQESLRKIILFLLTKRRANNEKIAAAVALSPSTVSWHMLKLLEGGVVEKRRVGRKTFFYIIQPEKTIELLSSYKRSFLDEMVDGFVAMWEEMQVPAK